MVGLGIWFYYKMSARTEHAPSLFQKFHPVFVDLLYIDLSLATVAYAILITLVDLWYVIVSNLNCKSEVNTQCLL